MRKTFLNIEEFPTIEDAETECPWACSIEEVEDGWRCFESATDWQMWTNQT